jgi:hypothetical protein
LPHARAAIGQQIDQPFGGQNFQGLAQRRARNPEHGAQLALRHPAAVGDVALDDIVAQAGEDLVVQRGFLAAAAASDRTGRAVASLGIRGFMADHNRKKGSVDEKLNANFWLSPPELNAI